jgi:hypothetical protein
MDDDTSELTTHLCTRIGMIMEDVSPRALGMRGKDPDRQRAALQEITRASGQIQALIAAAKALLG